MNKTQLALTATALIAAGLGLELIVRNRQLARLSKSSIKLVEWSGIAQQVMAETWQSHPELIHELSEEVRTNIDFYNLMIKENLI
jgi:hypothetical protein